MNNTDAANVLEEGPPRKKTKHLVEHNVAKKDLSSLPVSYNYIWYLHTNQVGWFFFYFLV